MTCLFASLGLKLQVALHGFDVTTAESQLVKQAMPLPLYQVSKAGAQWRLAQVGELTLAVSRLGNEKVMLEQSMEMEEEGIVNRLQRVIESVMARNKVGPLACHI